GLPFWEAVEKLVGRPRAEHVAASDAYVRRTVGELAEAGGRAAFNAAMAEKREDVAKGVKRLQDFLREHAGSPYEIPSREALAEEFLRFQRPLEALAQTAALLSSGTLRWYQNQLLHARALWGAGQRPAAIGFARELAA